MKKTISFNLEEDIINKIEEYQKENKLSSRSAALERIILGLDNNKNNNNENINTTANIDIKELIREILKEVNINTEVEEKIEEEVEEIKNVFIDDTMNDIYGSMD